MGDLEKALAEPSERSKYLRYHLNVPLKAAEDPVIDMAKGQQYGGGVDLRQWPEYDVDLLIDRVALPAGGLHDLGECRALGALHHRDYFGLLVAALGRLRGTFLGGRRFFCRFRLLRGLPRSSAQLPRM